MSSSQVDIPPVTTPSSLPNRSSQQDETLDPSSLVETPSLSTDAVVTIEPPKRFAAVNLRELWRYRDLFLLLLWRDIAARYRQSVVGIGWAVVKPIVSMLIFTFVFGRIAGIESDGSPYPLFTFSALLPWMYFSGALMSVTGSVVGAAGLLKKVYFPRLILPLVGAVTGLVELMIQMVVLALLMIWYQFVPSWSILCAPLFVLLGAATALAGGLWLTALNVKFRDVGQALPFIVQAWMWLSPIVYSSHDVPDHLRHLYSLNPLVGVIEGFRWSILGTTTPDWSMIGLSTGTVLVMLTSGLFFFRKTEDTFADIV